jgi:hypothetical protein
LRQGIILTGLGTSTFNEAMESAMLIHTQFERAFKEGAVDKCQLPTYKTYEVFGASNCYFSLCRYNGTATGVAFPPLVDPKGILAGLAGDNLIHLDENQGYYYEITKFNKTGNLRSVSTTSVRAAAHYDSIDTARRIRQLSKMVT